MNTKLAVFFSLSVFAFAACSNGQRKVATADDFEYSSDFDHRMHYGTMAEHLPSNLSQTCNAWLGSALRSPEQHGPNSDYRLIETLAKVGVSPEAAANGATINGLCRNATREFRDLGRNLNPQAWNSNISRVVEHFDRRGTSRSMQARSFRGLRTACASDLVNGALQNAIFVIYTSGARSFEHPCPGVSDVN